MKRASRIVDLMHLLLHLRDPQTEFLLLPLCIGIAKHFFLPMEVPTDSLGEAAMLFEKRNEGRLKTL